MAFLDQFDHAELTKTAKAERPGLKRWVSAGGGGTRRTYTCNLCGELIDTESARNAPTKHAAEAIAEHRDAHVAEIVSDKNAEELRTGVSDEAMIRAMEQGPRFI